MSRFAFLLIALFSFSVCSETKLNLGHLGKTKAAVKTEKNREKVSPQTEAIEGLVEEEVVSSTVYSSDGKQLGVRSNVELVKPSKLELNIKKKPVAPKKQPQTESSLAFIDKALGIKPVQAWEKGTLAKPEMKPGGLVPEFDVFSEKVFSYKQGSIGGSGVGGGGCGCN